MTEASVSFAGNLTDDRQLWAHRGRGSPGPCSEWRCQGGGNGRLVDNRLVSP
jgi:hypothetical protein